MNETHRSPEQLTHDIVRVIARRLDLSRYRIFLFGSRATNRGTEQSDFDIGIEGSQAVPPEVMARIREDVRKIPTLYKIDVVDFKTVTPEFRNVALQETKPLTAETRS